MKKITLILITTLLLNGLGFTQTHREFDYIADRLNYETAAHLLKDEAVSVLGEEKNYSTFFSLKLNKTIPGSYKININIAKKINIKGTNLGADYNSLDKLTDFEDKIKELIGFCVKQMELRDKYTLKGEKKLSDELKNSLVEEKKVLLKRLNDRKEILIPEASKWYVDKIINKEEKISSKIEKCEKALKVKGENEKLKEKLKALNKEQGSQENISTTPKLPEENPSGDNPVIESNNNKEIKQLNTKIKELEKQINSLPTKVEASQKVNLPLYMSIISLLFVLLLFFKLNKKKPKKSNNGNKPEYLTKNDLATELQKIKVNNSQQSSTIQPNKSDFEQKINNLRTELNTKIDNLSNIQLKTQSQPQYKQTNNNTYSKPVTNSNKSLQNKEFFYITDYSMTNGSFNENNTRPELISTGLDPTYYEAYFDANTSNKAYFYPVQNSDLQKKMISEIDKILPVCELTNSPNGSKITTLEKGEIIKEGKNWKLKKKCKIKID